MKKGPNNRQKRARVQTSQETSGEKRKKTSDQAQSLSPISNLPSEILQQIFAYTSKTTKTFPAAVGGVSHRFREECGSFLLWRSGLGSETQINQAHAIQQHTINRFLDNQAKILEETNNSSEVAKCFDNLIEANQFKMNDGCSFTVREQLIEQLNAAIIRSRIEQSDQNKGLDCSNCYLTCFPASVLQDPTLRDYWAKLQWLYLHSNQLTALPLEIGQLARLKTLDLSNNPLTTLAAEIGQLKKLIILNLNHTQLTSLPEEIGLLRALQEFTICNSQLTTLPAQIGQLLKLRVLLLESNQLATLPAQIGQLLELQILRLHSNRLTTLPAEIGQLAALDTLDLSNNLFSTLPAEIGQHARLLHLILSNNQLTNLPNEIGQLRQLMILNLEHNQLTTLPAEIGELSLLETLELSNNLLTTLPTEIGNLASLETLDLSHNRLTSLPPEIRHLTALRRLHLNHNQLTHIPPGLTGILKSNVVNTDNQVISTKRITVDELLVTQTPPQPAPNAEPMVPEKRLRNT